MKAFGAGLRFCTVVRFGTVLVNEIKSGFIDASGIKGSSNCWKPDAPRDDRMRGWRTTAGAAVDVVWTVSMVAATAIGGGGERKGIAGAGGRAEGPRVFDETLSS